MVQVPNRNTKMEKFSTCFTEYDKERTDSITTEEASYSINQVQEMVQSRIQNEMAAWFQSVTDENVNPNQSPSNPLPPASANTLTDADLKKLVNLFKPTHTSLKPKVYVWVAQGKDDKGRDITYCYSHEWIRNFEHDSKNCTCRVDGHKEEATQQNKMGR